MSESRNQNQNHHPQSLSPRLSEHILLGDALGARNPQVWFMSSRGCGCALGRAVFSAGRLNLEKSAQFSYVDASANNHAYKEIQSTWPWLMKTTPAKDLTDGGYYFAEKDFIWEISRRFHKVCDGLMTLEQLVDQVRIWEDEFDDALKAAEEKSATTVESESPAPIFQSQSKEEANQCKAQAQ